MYIFIYIFIYVNICHTLTYSHFAHPLTHNFFSLFRTHTHSPSLTLSYTQACPLSRKTTKPKHDRDANDKICLSLFSLTSSVSLGPFLCRI